MKLDPSPRRAKRPRMSLKAIAFVQVAVYFTVRQFGPDLRDPWMLPMGLAGIVVLVALFRLLEKFLDSRG